MRQNPLVLRDLERRTKLDQNAAGWRRGVPHLCIKRQKRTPQSGCRAVQMKMCQDRQIRIQRQSWKDLSKHVLQTHAQNVALNSGRCEESGVECTSEVGAITLPDPRQKRPRFISIERSQSRAAILVHQRSATPHFLCSLTANYHCRADEPRPKQSSLFQVWYNSTVGSIYEHSRTKNCR